MSTRDPHHKHERLLFTRHKKLFKCLDTRVFHNALIHKPTPFCHEKRVDSTSPNLVDSGASEMVASMLSRFFKKKPESKSKLKPKKAPPKKVVKAAAPPAAEPPLRVPKGRTITAEGWRRIMLRRSKKK
jgi:hypothetical protein